MGGRAAIALLAWALGPQPSMGGGAEALPLLEPGVTVERELGPGESHAFRLEPAGEEALLITAEQRGVDLALALTSLEGEVRAEIDSPIGPRGIEALLAPEALRSAPLRLVVRSVEAGGTRGSYRLLAEALPKAGTERIASERRWAEAVALGVGHPTAGGREALERYREAAAGFGALGLVERQATALHAAGGIAYRTGDARGALAALGEALPLWRSLDDRPRQAECHLLLGLAALGLGDAAASRDHFAAARDAARALGDPLTEAQARANLCLVEHSQGRLRAARSCYQEALAIFHTLGERASEVAMLSSLGEAENQLGEPRRAIGRHREALALAREGSERQAEARALNNLAVALDAAGELSEALSLYAEARERFRALGDRAWEARALHNLGAAYDKLGEASRAGPYFEEALALRRELGDRRGEAGTLASLSAAAVRAERFDLALSMAEQSLAGARAVGDRRGEGTALRLIGQARLARGEVEAARAALEGAVAALAEAGDRSQQARASTLLGTAWERAGDPASGLGAVGEALALARSSGDPVSEAVALTSLAGLEGRLGRPQLARDHALAAIAAVESVRARIASPDLRATFLATSRRAYELAIGAEVALDASAPEAGHARAALALSERARARRLLDLLAEARADLSRGVDPELARRRRALVERLNAKASRRLLPAAAPRPEAAEDERELIEVLGELDAVEAEIRRESPRYAAIASPEILAAADLQRLLDGETLLLEFALGEERSFVFAVGREGLAAHALPPRAEIEAAARAVHADLRTVAADAASASAEAERAAALSRLLLGPAAASLGRKRLLIVPDGALHLVPFAALPEPAGAQGPAAAAGTGGALPLLERHEVITLPSASAVAASRRRGTARIGGVRAVAVVADPVFEAGDPRVAAALADRPAGGAGAAVVGAAPGPEPERGTVLDGFPLSRLPATRREAEAILALAAPGAGLAALDFQARREAVVGGLLATYPIVHFATHGVVHAGRPELSGIVLSLVDEQGRPEDGLLSLSDIYDLELAADLVVLSGCETALGREVSGEGLVGLTQGFLHAGARQVVASLWRVGDRATAELMTRFYRAHLVDGQGPAAALRTAQLALSRDRRLRDPYHWAAFVVQGDWE